MSAFVVTLQGGAPWGIRLQGGGSPGEPLRIAKVSFRTYVSHCGSVRGQIPKFKILFASGICVQRASHAYHKRYTEIERQCCLM